MHGRVELGSSTSQVGLEGEIAIAGILISIQPHNEQYYLCGQWFTTGTIRNTMCHDAFFHSKRE